MNIEDIKKLRALAVAADQPHSGVARDYFRQSVTAPRMLALLDLAERQLNSFQQRVHPWMLECFGEMIAGDREERNHRFLEEALELVQSTGCTASEAHQLVDYVYGRPVGEPAQEVGGVMVTLAALCLANAMDMHTAGETELARIWTKVEAIRAKQAAKPKHSPLPEVAPQQHAQAALSDEHWKLVAGVQNLSALFYNTNCNPQGFQLALDDLAKSARAILATRQPAPIDRAAIHRKVLERGMDGPEVVGPTVCTVPPAGWACTRAPGHDGPCAAVPVAPVAAAVQGDVETLRSIGEKWMSQDGRDELEDWLAAQPSTVQGDAVPAQTGMQGDLHVAAHDDHLGYQAGDEREAFESVVGKLGKWLYTRNGDGTYQEIAMQGFWSIWQAALAQRAAGEDSERDAAPTASQERAWFKVWLAGLSDNITVDQIEFGRRAWAERARRAAEGGA